MAQSNRDYAVMRRLVQEGPGPAFKGMTVEEVPFSLLDLKPGFRYECRWSYRE
jgi:hypothetical protein